MFGWPITYYFEMNLKIRERTPFVLSEKLNNSVLKKQMCKLAVIFRRFIVYRK